MAFGFFGFPAHFIERRTFDLTEEELFGVVKSAFENLGWLAYEIHEGREFHKWLHNSPMTWGEEFTVRILPGGVVEAESKSDHTYRPMLFDFGANRQNVEIFFARLEREIKERRM